MLSELGWQAAALLWHLQRCDASTAELVQCATTPEVFEQMWDNQGLQAELSSLWSNLCNDGKLVPSEVGVFVASITGAELL